MGVLSLRARLVLALAYVLVLAIGSMLVPLVRSVRDRVNAEVETQALSQAEVVAATYSGGAAADELVASAAREVRGRVVIVDRDGVVVADSSPGSVGANFSSRSEIARALRGETVREQRDSSTLGTRILATAVPVVRNGERDGAVRITQSVDAVGRALRSATLGLMLVGLIVLVLGLAAGALLAA
jgi:sensor histidine kinase regulating citrate/malate metabolism